MVLSVLSLDWTTKERGVDNSLKIFSKLFSMLLPKYYRIKEIRYLIMNNYLHCTNYDLRKKGYENIWKTNFYSNHIMWR
jgi:hypothetical protein